MTEFTTHQTEKPFTNLIEDAAKKRFGIRDEASKKEVDSKAVEATLKNYGYEIIARNDEWIQFGSELAEANIWSNLPYIEERALKERKPFPPSLTSRFKIICTNVSVKDLEYILELCQATQIPISAKIATENNDLQYLVIYSNGLIPTLDLALNIAWKLKVSEQNANTMYPPIDKARPVIPGYRVFLTQGTYNNKRYAESIGAGNRYTPDGAFFVEKAEEIETYMKRRTNQIVIEENLPIFDGLKPSEAVVTLQRAIFDGIEPSRLNFDLGIRNIEVCVGRNSELDPGYIAPSAEKLEELLGFMDKRYKEMLDNLPKKPDFAQAARLASFLYTTTILIHPLEDGNGQAAKSLAMLTLYQLGMRRIYLRSDSKQVNAYCLALDLAVTSEAPTIYRTRALDPNKEQNLQARDRQIHSYTLIKTALNKYWDIVSGYIKTNGGVEETLNKYELTDEDKRYLSSYLKRLKQVAEYIEDQADEEPFGSTDLTYYELSKLEDAFKST